MSYFDSFILGIVEGITEFLPISSTGHLILTSYILGLEGETLKAYEVVIQVGAILAVIKLYFDDFKKMLFSLFSNKDIMHRNLLINFFLSFLPVAIIGLFLNKVIKIFLFNTYTVALALIIGAFFMFVFDVKFTKKNSNNIYDLTRKKALIIGFFQILALWPGFSRALSVILGCLFVGLSKKDAAKYSFLLALPVLVSAGIFDSIKYFNNLVIEIGIINIFIGLITSFLVAFFIIKGFILWLSKNNFLPFVIYRLLIGILILIFLK